MLTNKITDRFLTVVGLFENVLGKYANNIAYNQKREQIKKILFEVYDVRDIYDFFPPQLEERRVNQFLKTVFNYTDLENLGVKK